MAAGLMLGLVVMYLFLEPQVSGFSIKESALKERITILEQGLQAINGATVKNTSEIDTSQKNIESLTARLNATLQEKQIIEAQVSTLTTKLSDAQRDLELKANDLKSAQNNLQVEKDRYSKMTKQISQLSSSLDRLNYDKTILMYLRQDSGPTREDSKTYWLDFKTILTKTDSSFGKKIDTIILYTDPYFDWLDAAPYQDATPEEVGLWMMSIPPESSLYGAAVNTVINDIYFLVVSDIASAVESAP